MGKESSPAKWVPIDTLVPMEGNPREHTDMDVDAVAASLKEWGWGEVIVANADNTVIAGHGRLAAAKKLGMDKVPVRYLDMAPKDARDFAVALNRIAELSKWDVPTLASVLGELDEHRRDLVGFSAEAAREVLEQMARFGMGGGNGTIIEDEVPDPPKDPITKLGDVWEMGEHLLLCGNAEEPRAVCASSEIKLLVTDPPYGVSYASKNAFLNKTDAGNRIEVAIEHDHENLHEMAAFWTRSFSAVRPLMLPGAAYYVTGPQGGDFLLLLLLALREAGLPLRHMLVWAKNHLVFGRSDYHYKHEQILYGWVDGGPHHAVVARGETSLWEIDRPHKSGLHPTTKPVELYARAIRNSSHPGELVLDPFAGSGTCIIAAEQLCRKARAVEISPHYCDVIVERWQNLTGKKAQRRGIG